MRPEPVDDPPPRAPRPGLPSARLGGQVVRRRRSRPGHARASRRPRSGDAVAAGHGDCRPFRRRPSRPPRTPSRGCCRAEHPCARRILRRRPRRAGGQRGCRRRRGRIAHGTSLSGRTGAALAPASSRSGERGTRDDRSPAAAAGRSAAQPSRPSGCRRSRRPRPRANLDAECRQPLQDAEREQVIRPRTWGVDPARRASMPLSPVSTRGRPAARRNRTPASAAANPASRSRATSAAGPARNARRDQPQPDESRPDTVGAGQFVSYFLAGEILGQLQLNDCDLRARARRRPIPHRAPRAWDIPTQLSSAAASSPVTTSSLRFARSSRWA